MVTIVGEVTYWRRYYVDPQTGERRFLLDERLGIAERQRLSPGLREQAVTLAMEMSYRRAAKVLSQWVPAIMNAGRCRRAGGRSGSCVSKPMG
ncbi:MAG: hypothetical protein BLM47_14295 [Candidatus Reconcilbacillus cellulovorans]|uniref:Uncharacterized protein n=1 Tax=Candidatus Reconcilbacillus cellulovorans TaxID=1906605 RepID=A0A2A6DWS2_9BACL|nr:MAG: hypothetical protein BLM47_14295 [Candidatus Reconcilbacillus cellulovorans]